MADDLVTLTLPPGVDGYPISHGDRSFPYYRPDPDGPFLVDVPPEVAEPLLIRGGFSRMAPKEDTTVMPASFIMMRGPAGHSGFSFGGHSYMPDENGVAMIPVGAVEIARSHGFHGAAEAERVDANAAALAKGAAIVNLKTKLVAMLNPAKCEHTTDGAYNLPESDTERAKSGSV